MLIDATLDLVAERDSLEFTVQEVVDRTGLSLHAFYQLFESKDALVEAVLEESLERGVAELRDRVDAETRPDRPASGRSSSATTSSPPRAANRSSPGQAFTEFSRAPRPRAPAKAWKTFRPLRVLAYELLRAAVDDGAGPYRRRDRPARRLRAAVGPRPHRARHRRTPPRPARPASSSGSSSPTGSPDHALI